VSGTKLTFRNGTALGFGGCVYYSSGAFACADCVFDKCTATGKGGGGVVSAGTLDLVHPTFTGRRCGDTPPCGSGCYCYGDDTSRCVGCSCKNATGTTTASDAMIDPEGLK